VSSNSSFSATALLTMLLDRGLMARRRFPVAKIEDSSSSGVEFVVVFALFA
jgi:hypothetical protein